ncbi:MAG: SCO family protein [Casimicrobiaceae bacterium]
MQLGRYFAGAVILAATVANAAVSNPERAAGEHQHHNMPTQAGVTNRSTANYAIPEVRLTRQDGKVVKFREELDDGRPVVLSFIYTSCSSVCPLISHTLSQLQTKLGDDAGRVHLMSITIDPEQDSPGRLREYAKTFNAGPEWQHYGGTLAASQAVQRAFDVYRGSKMDHVPATLIRPAPGAPWTRIEGFATADQLLAELPGRSDLAGR